MITALPEDKILHFLSYLNSSNSCIQFTHEVETNNSIPYLDLQIYKEQNGSLTFGIYRKPTHSGRYLNYNSYHSMSQKRGVIHTILHRAETLPDEIHKKTELNRINTDFLKNGYSKQLINNVRHKVTRPKPSGAASNERLKYVKVPYIRGVSERFSKILLPFGIKLANKSGETLRKKLCKLKDKRPTLEKTGCVYKIECDDCDKKYIGETGKEVTKRIAEHKRAVKRGDASSNIFSHIIETKHDINWSDASVLAQNKNNRSRKMLEAIHTLGNSRDALIAQWIFLLPTFQSSRDIFNDLYLISMYCKRNSWTGERILIDTANSI